MGNNQSSSHHQRDLIPLLVMSMDPIVQALVFFTVCEAEKERLKQEEDDARLVAATAEAASKIIVSRAKKRVLAKHEKFPDLYTAGRKRVCRQRNHIQVANIVNNI